MYAAKLRYNRCVGNLEGVFIMETGKLSSDNLQEMIIDQIKPIHEDILIRPGIGEDCSAVAFGEYACVLSTDPITGAASEIGRLAVHINCNDIASSGVKPMALMLTILVPPSTTAEELNMIMKQASEEAAKLGVDIIGGHTEITTAVNRPLVSATALGKQLKDKLVTSSGSKPGDKLIMTKNVALEGTGILAYDKEDVLVDVLGIDELQIAKDMLDDISVIPEGVAAGEYGVSAMHDVTEGGVLGAVWEICEASELGCVLKRDALPVHEVTTKICSHFGIDPYKLISSGCMLITVEEGKTEGLMNKLDEKNIPAAVIGTMTEAKGVFLNDGNEVMPVEPPEADELYKVVD